MVDHARLTQVLLKLTRGLLDDLEVSDFLHLVAESAAEVLDVTGTGISIVVGERVQFVTSPTLEVVRVEEVQDRFQAGPCIDAIRTSRPSLVSDISTRSTVWPDYVRVAGEAGITSVMGVPMVSTTEAVGAISVHSASAREWTPDEVDIVTVIANIGAAHLVAAGRLQRSLDTAEQLQNALDSRIVIEQAKGAVAVSRAFTVEEAFELLRRYARSSGIPLRTVAEDVVRRGLLLVPDA